MKYLKLQIDQSILNIIQSLLPCDSAAYIPCSAIIYEDHTQPCRFKKRITRQRIGKYNCWQNISVSHDVICLLTKIDLHFLYRNEFSTFLWKEKLQFLKIMIASYHTGNEVFRCYCSATWRIMMGSTVAGSEIVSKLLDSNFRFFLFKTSVQRKSQCYWTYFFARQPWYFLHYGGNLHSIKIVSHHSVFRMISCNTSL